MPSSIHESHLQQLPLEFGHGDFLVSLVLLHLLVGDLQRELFLLQVVLIYSVTYLHGHKGICSILWVMTQIHYSVAQTVLVGHWGLFQVKVGAFQYASERKFLSFSLSRNFLFCLFVFVHCSSCIYPAPPLGSSTTPKRTLISFIEEEYLEAKIWTLGGLIATQVSCFQSLTADKARGMCICTHSCTHTVIYIVSYLSVYIYLKNQFTLISPTPI